MRCDMVVVAIAGASSSLGEHIISAILQTRRHKVIALSRHPHPALGARGVEVRIVDYDESYADLAKTLTGIHTLMSTIGGYAAAVDPQLKLIAAAKAAGVRRFAPSEFGFNDNTFSPMHKLKDHVMATARQSGMEVTKFSTGLSTNLLGVGSPEEKLRLWAPSVYGLL